MTNRASAPDFEFLPAHVAKSVPVTKTGLIAGAGRGWDDLHTGNQNERVA